MTPLTLALLLVPLPRSRRARWRLRHPSEAENADRLADSAVWVVVAVCSTFVLLASVPGLPGNVPRLLPLGAAAGIATGIPYVLDRRAMRRRLRAAERPRDPLPPRHPELAGSPAAALLASGDGAAALAALGPLPEKPEGPELRLRALAAALVGDAELGRACAARCVQLDPSAWPLLTDTGLLLCRAGRFTAGIGLLEAAAARGQASAPDDGVERHQVCVALVEGLRCAGRLREAVTAMDGCDRGNMRAQRGIPPGA